MAKQTKDEPELTAEQLLEARVDAMMQIDGKPAPSEPAGAPLLPGSRPHKTRPAMDIHPAKKSAPKPVDTTPAEAALMTEAEPDPPAPIPAVASHDAIVVQPVELDTPDSDAAIDDIVAEEADVVLAAEDAGLTRARQEADATHQATHRVKHPIFWFLVTVAALSIIMIAVLTFLPATSMAP